MLLLACSTGFADANDEAHEFCSKVLRTQPVLSRLHTEFRVELKEIGAGNFSKVFRARHRLDGCDYAIKRTKQPIASDHDRNRWLQVRARIYQTFGCTCTLGQCRCEADSVATQTATILPSVLEWTLHRLKRHSLCCSGARVSSHGLPV